MIIIIIIIIIYCISQEVRPGEDYGWKNKD